MRCESNDWPSTPEQNCQQTATCAVEIQSRYYFGFDWQAFWIPCCDQHLSDYRIDDTTVIEFAGA